MNILYAQLIGAAAMLTMTLSVQCRKKKHMMLVQSAAHMLYSFQYALLGAFSAAFMDIISVLRISIFYKYDKGKKKIPLILPVIIILITAFVGTLTYTNPLSLLPVIVAIIYTIGASFKDPKVYKLVFGTCAIAWLFYNLKFQAYVCVIGNIMEITSTAVALIRETKRKKRKKKVTKNINNLKTHFI